MDREQQIKEIEKELSKIQTVGSVITENQMDMRYPTVTQIKNIKVAERIYNAGYRKQSEVAMEIFEEIDKQLAPIKKYGYANQIAQIAFDMLDEIKKKYIEGK